MGEEMMESLTERLNSRMKLLERYRGGGEVPQWYLDEWNRLDQAQKGLERAEAAAREALKEVELS